MLKKSLLLAMIIALPTLLNAAESVPAAEVQNSAPAPSAVISPQTPPAADKPSEAAPVKQSPKLGYVDINRIGSDSDRGKALKKLLTNKKESLQAKLESRKKQLEKLKASIESKLAGMTPQQREAKSKEFQKKLGDFQKFASNSEEELYKLQEKETKALFEDLERVAAEYGQANSYAAIVIKKELLYVGNAVDAQDVTDALIKSLNSIEKKK